MEQKLYSDHYFIAPISSSKAYQFTSYYHYSGVGFKKAQVNQGIFNFNNELVGVLQWGCSAQEGIKLDRYIQEPMTNRDYLELNRFCMADSEGKNAESEAIGLGIRWIKKYRPDIQFLVSYAGRKEGNYGYIYQATNWAYLGYFISPGFWICDGQEKHQITLWYIYQKHCDTNLPFKESLCQHFNSLTQTWSKQFIYVQKLNKKLHYASEVLPYPKATNEYPIVVESRTYKEGAAAAKPDRGPIPQFTYDPDEPLFTRAAMLRHGLITAKPWIAVYDRNGDFIEEYETLQNVADALDITPSTVSTAMKNGKFAGGCYFRRHNLNDPIEEKIDVPYVAKINGEVFIKQTEIANYINVSRQAVSFALQRGQTNINGYTIEWRQK